MGLGTEKRSKTKRSSSSLREAWLTHASMLAFPSEKDMAPIPQLKDGSGMDLKS